MPHLGHRRVVGNSLPYRIVTGLFCRMARVASMDLHSGFAHFPLWAFFHSLRQYAQKRNSLPVSLLQRKHVMRVCFGSTFEHQAKQPGHVIVMLSLPAKLIAIVFSTLRISVVVKQDTCRTCLYSQTTGHC